MRKRVSCLAALLLTVGGSAFGSAQLYSATEANVIVFKRPGVFEPGGGDLEIMESRHVAGWTTLATEFTPTSVKIFYDIIMDGHLTPGGFVVVDGLSVPAPLNDYGVAVNQERDDLSLLYFAAPRPFEAVRVRAFPSGGDYQSSVRVDFLASPAAAGIQYRLDGGAYQPYVPGASITIWKDTVLEYYAILGPDSSSVQRNDYRIHQRGDADTDGDGLPDFVELAYGLDPWDGLVDSDGDGWEDLDEVVRGSDPRNFLSVPADTDGDSWSDYDENLRGTNPNDPEDFPAAAGVNTCEYLLHATAVRDTTGDDKFSDGSVMRFSTLYGKRIADATVEGGSVVLRLSAGEPLIARAVENSNHNLGVMAYLPECKPCVNRRALYVPGMTAAQWVNAYRTAYEAEMVHSLSDFVLDASSTAQVLLLARFMEQKLASPVPFHLPAGGSPYLTIELRHVHVTPYFYENEVVDYFGASLPPSGGLLGQVQAFMDGVGAGSMRPILLSLADAYHGLVLGATELPAGVSQAQLEAQRSANDALIAAAPSRLFSASGILQMDEEGLHYVQVALENNVVVNVRVDFERAEGPETLIPGSVIHFSGLRLEHCDFPGQLFVEVESYALSFVPLDENVVDSDSDGLPDQWELFYFGHLDYGPGDDPDGDFADNATELANFTDPSDGSSGGLTPTPTPTATGTPTVTATPTPSFTATPSFTPTLTPTPTPTGIFNPYDLNLDFAINELDLFILIQSLLDKTDGGDVNKDGKSDHLDVLDFAIHWQAPLAPPATPTPTPTP